MTKTRNQRRADAVERLREVEFDASGFMAMGSAYATIIDTALRRCTDSDNDECDALIDLLSEDECKDVSKFPRSFVCSECGTYMKTMDEEGEPTLWDANESAAWPNHCPNCGARITQGPSEGPSEVVVGPSGERTKTEHDGADGGQIADMSENDGGFVREVRQMSDSRENGDGGLQSHESDSPRPESETTDSREKLEADVREHVAYSTSTLLYPASANKTTDMLGMLPIDVVSDWLDRQAAITERKWFGICDKMEEQYKARLHDVCRDTETTHVAEGEGAMSDTREKLEADIEDACKCAEDLRLAWQEYYLEERGIEVDESTLMATYSGHVMYAVILDFVRRQAAIARRECADELEKERDDLNREYRRLEEQHDKLSHEHAELRDLHANLKGDYVAETYENISLHDRLDKLNYELAHVRNATGEMVEEMWHSREAIRVERDELDDLLSEHGIEVERDGLRHFAGIYDHPLYEANTQIEHMREACADMVAELWRSHKRVTSAGEAIYRRAERIAKERNELRKQRDELQEKLDAAQERIEYLRTELSNRERDCNKLKNGNEILKSGHIMGDWCYLENLRQLANTSKHHSDEEWKRIVLRLTKNAEKYVDMETVDLRCNLDAANERIELLESTLDDTARERDELREGNEALAKREVIELPVDADGLPIYAGDKVEGPNGESADANFLTVHEDGAWDVGTRGWVPSWLRHCKPTVEDVLSDFACAYDDIGGLDNEDEAWAKLLDEYASKLQLKGNES